MDDLFDVFEDTPQTGKPSIEPPKLVKKERSKKRQANGDVKPNPHEPGGEENDPAADTLMVNKDNLGVSESQSG